MNRLNEKTTNYKDAIKCIGVGKKGSRNMPGELVEAVIREKKRNMIPDAAWGALIGALINKGPSKEEYAFETLFEPGLFKNPSGLIDQIEPALEKTVKALYLKLLAKQTLDASEAKELGRFLFDPASHLFFKGMAASIMRVRYETAEEYQGLIDQLKATFAKSLTNAVPAGAPIIQVAEPFDGVDHSLMITPAVAGTLAKLNFRVVSLAGRNSGPKLEVNLFDIVQELGGSFLRSSDEFKDSQGPYGYFLNQADLSGAMDSWVDIRREIIKRPFMSTIERFVNPFNADILIASAFHPPYGEKMLAICENQNCKAAIIVRNGIEGSIAFPLLRSAKILCTVKTPSGSSYTRHEFEFDSKKELDHDVTVETRVVKPSAKANALLIKNYVETTSSGDKLFDLRVKATCEGLKRAIKWLGK